MVSSDMLTGVQVGRLGARFFWGGGGGGGESGRATVRLRGLKQ